MSPVPNLYARLSTRATTANITEHACARQRRTSPRRTSPRRTSPRRARATAANITEIREMQAHAHAQARRWPDGSPDKAPRDAAPTRKPPNANAHDHRARDPVAVRPAPLSHFEDFFGWRAAEQSQADGRRGEAAGPAGTLSTPSVRCLRHRLFEAECPYDASSDARLHAALDMLTTQSHELALRQTRRSSACATPG